jgi:DNA-binding response OmpR family regulator
MTLSSKRQVDQHPSSLEGVRVLVVEDTWHVAKALKSALEQIGMDVSGPAATTAEARRLIAEHMPRLAVVDVNLKREMACGLIEELHDQGVSVVVVSGYALPPILEDKAAAILQKPVSGSTLLAALQGVVTQSRSSPER